MSEAIKPGLAAVRSLVAEAKPVPVPPGAAPPQRPGTVSGTPGKEWAPGDEGLPPDCPVIPLGYQGEINWLLDPVGQLVAYAEPFSKGKTLTLFRGRHDFLSYAWPRYGKDGVVNSWENDTAAVAITLSCTRKGAWSPEQRLRGVGCWRDDRGRLLIHCGDKLLVGGREMGPGEHGGHVYPTKPAIPDPWPGPIDPARNPVRLLRPLLRKWSWSRPDVDPHLLLGWIGCALLGPALPWRSNIYLTGDAGMGKSTLQALVKGILGEWLLKTADTTAAGIYQHIGHDGVAVAVDEFEGEDDNRAAVKVLKLARKASSGDKGLRGGDRGKGTEFEIRSAFLFSSINTPPLQPQDLSRFALLKLQRLRRDEPPPVLDAAELALMGRIILARVAREFGRLAETYAAFRAELARAGMDARGCDTFGTLLACADLIEHEGWDEERLSAPTEDGDLKRWAELLNVKGLAEYEDRAENWRACLDRMLSVPVEAWRNGTRRTVGQMLADWHADPGDFDNDIAKVKTQLSQAGLGIVRKGRGSGDWVVVPNQNPILQGLFEGTKWYGEPGAGVWSGALRQSPRGEVHEVELARINGVKCRCTLLSLEALYGPDGIMSDGQPGPEKVTTAHPDLSSTGS